MKKLLLLTIINFSLAFLLKAQKLNTNQVPEIVKTSFNQKYPNNKCYWEKEGNHYEGNFKLKGISMSVLYDADGSLIETEESMKVSKLPSIILNYIKEKYKGDVIKEAAKITKANGIVNFEAEVNHKDLLFDADGKFIKVTTD